MGFSMLGELLLLLGVLLFVFGAIGFLSGYLTQEQIPSFAALTLIFVGVGAGLKKKG